MTRRSLVAAVALLALVVGGCSDGAAEGPAATDTAPAGGGNCRTGAPEALVPEVVRTLEHDPQAYTQGLVVHDGRLFESTGLEGHSSIRELDLDSGRALRVEPLDEDVFGEGLAVGRDDRLVQLTWTEGIAYERDPVTLAELGGFTYEGEGWGLTTLDDGRLVMSDGSDRLVVRDPQTFDELDSMTIRREGGAANRLNELEFDGTSVWANRYRTDEVLRIDLECSQVTGVLDVAELTAAARAAAGEGDPEPEVANGIAHLPGTDRFLLTGKRWPTMYEVVLRPAG